MEAYIVNTNKNLIAFPTYRCLYVTYLHSWKREWFIWRAIWIPQNQENNKCKDLVNLIDFGENITLTKDCAAYKLPQHYKEFPPLAIKCKLEVIENTFWKSTDRDRRKYEQLLQKKWIYEIDISNTTTQHFKHYNKLSADKYQNQSNSSVLNISNKHSLPKPS